MPHRRKRREDSYANVDIEKAATDFLKAPPFMQFIILVVLLVIVYYLLIAFFPDSQQKIKAIFIIAGILAGVLVISIIVLFVWLPPERREEGFLTITLRGLGWFFGMKKSDKTSKEVKPERIPIPSKLKVAIFKAYRSKCAMCGVQEHLEIHHIDGERTNNKALNLIPLCPTCHSKNFTKEQYMAMWKSPKY